MSKTNFYRRWSGIKARCTNKKMQDYPRYGGRGIKCKWETFESFFIDMYEEYVQHYKKNKGDTQIDRIDSSKDYCKENCRWVTRLEQARNLNDRRAKTVDYKGKTYRVSELAEKLKINKKKFI